MFWFCCMLHLQWLKEYLILSSRCSVDAQLLHGLISFQINRLRHQNPLWQQAFNIAVKTQFGHFNPSCLDSIPAFAFSFTFLLMYTLGGSSIA